MEADMSGASDGFAHPEFLVESEWLAAHLDDPELRVLDCTIHLIANPDIGYTVKPGREDFEKGHIPGAQYIDLQADLSAPHPKLRFMLPSAEDFAAAMSRFGVGDRSRVILYSTTNPQWATRIWWMLRNYSFDNAAVLNGGFQKWAREGRPVEIEVDMLENQPRLIDHLKSLAMTLLERESLVERQAEFARNHVDRAGQQIGFERGGVLDRAHRDSPEMPSGSRPMGVRFKQHMRTGHHLADPIGPVIKPGIGRLGIIARAHPILRGVGEGRALDMRRQQREVVDRGIVEGQLVDMQREGLVVLDVDAGDAAIEFGVADRARRVAADLIGEQHVFGRHRHAVTPLGLGADRVGDVDAFLAIGKIDGNGQAIVDRRQRDAQEADKLPIGVIDGERPQRHPQHIALRRHRIDVRIERGRKLGHSDGQRFALGAACRCRQHKGEGERRQPAGVPPPR